MSGDSGALQATVLCCKCELEPKWHDSTHMTTLKVQMNKKPKRMSARNGMWSDRSPPSLPMGAAHDHCVSLLFDHRPLRRRLLGASATPPKTREPTGGSRAEGDRGSANSSRVNTTSEKCIIDDGDLHIKSKSGALNCEVQKRHRKVACTCASTTQRMLRKGRSSNQFDHKRTQLCERLVDNCTETRSFRGRQGRVAGRWHWSVGVTVAGRRHTVTCRRA